MPSHAQGAPSATATSTTTSAFRLGATDLIATLVDRAADHLTDEELQDLACLTEEAGPVLGQIASLTEGIACVVMHEDTEKRRGRGAGTGAFQDAESLSTLLLAITSLARHADAQIRAGQAASLALSARTRGGKQ